MRQTKQNIKLPPLGIDKDELNTRVSQSLHIQKGVNIRTVDEDRQKIKPRLKNSLSISSTSQLPLIKHHR